MAENASAENKTPSKPKKKGMGLFKRINKWFRETKAETKKIVWAPFKQVKNNTLVVIIMVLVVAAFIFLIDSAILYLYNLII